MVSLTNLLCCASLPLLASAQIVASCNPLTSSGCKPNPALGATFKEDFTQASDKFDAVSYPDNIKYSNDGASFTLAKRLDNPALKSNFYIMFGKVEVTFKAAAGQGIISSFYLQSDDLDEIDLEWVGGDTAQVQSNYFSKGNVETYDRGGFHPVQTPQELYHTYTIDWTKDELVFYVDGAKVRTIPANNPSGYPQSPMYIATGIWAGGDPSNEPGTIEWSGGPTDYSKAPFVMHIKDVVVSDYSTGKEYKYTDQTGAWTSIQAVDGEVNGRESLGEEQFELLANGGELSDTGSTTQSSSSSSSESSSESSSASSSSSSSASSSSSLESSSSSHGSLESSKSRVSSVYSSSASSLVSRSSSSSRTTVISASSSIRANSTTVAPISTRATSSEVPITSSRSSASLASNITTVTTERSSSTLVSSTSSSSVSSSAGSLDQSNNAVTFSLGLNGIKAMLLSIVVTMGLWIS